MSELLESIDESDNVDNNVDDGDNKRMRKRNVKMCQPKQKKHSNAI